MITGIILYILFLLSLYENVQSHFELSLKNFSKDVLKTLNLYDEKNGIIQNKDEDENKNKEVEKRFCVIVNSEDFMIKTENLDESNIKEMNIQIEVPENVVFLQDSTKKERKNAKNIFLEYLPIEKKIKLKKLLEDGEKIFSDYSVNEIL